jgi:pimeloyl-ACP methyl ester carboxylesterase
MRTIALLALLLLPTPVFAQTAPDRFITVNGVRLHYFDGGGSGSTLLMLVPGGGMGGGTGHGYDTFAPKFTDRFHVMVLTRRGQGLSRKSATAMS